ncbi:hypothetical protein AT15_08565 [Kosmotoga arenicorallina S304]|uniref:histidine kinase n=1 Tax=Kosmotoga arenicorallina S304 TaxID=1453497 RepID=A0A176K1J7_9BACT|nr:ATP-binding protein [Kosmotoga arenicorallina]OAA31018.1 hypothetical protein AT15_08565 [Kosmotoga arenicorallina S304]
MKREEAISKLLKLLDEVSNNRKLLPEVKKLLHDLGETDIADEIEESLTSEKGTKKLEEIKSRLTDLIKAETPEKSFEPDGKLAEEFLSEFFEELNMHLTETEQLLLEIEHDFSTEKLKEIMRHFHTIKGDSSLVMNMVTPGIRRDHLSIINKIAHSLEELFQRTQAYGSSYIQNRLDELFQILNALKTAADSPEKLSETEELFEKAESLLKRSGKTSDNSIETVKASQNILNQFLEFIEEGSLAPHQLKQLAENAKKGLEKAGKVEQCKLVDEIVYALEKGDSRRLKNAMGLLKKTFIKSTVGPSFEKPEEKDEDTEKEKYLRVEREKLDTMLNQISELSNLVLSLEQSEIAESQKKLIRNLKKLSSAMSRTVISVRAIKADELFSRFRLTARNFARNQGKKVLLHIEKTNVEIDRDISDNFVPLLTHLLRNAIDHGIEPPQERIKLGKQEEGNITLRAEYKGGFIFIAVEDDGRGISVETVKEKLIEKGIATPEELEKLSNSEILNYLFLPGFSTKDRVSKISGRGVGLDAVKKAVENMGGHVMVNSKSGEGTTFTLAIPLTLSIVKCIIFEVSGQKFAIKSDEISKTLSFDPSKIADYGTYSLLSLEGRSVPLVHLSECFGIKKSNSLQNSDRNSLAFLIYDRNGEEMVLVIDKILSEGEFLVKHLPELLKGVFSGAISLGREGLALLIDLNALLNII